VSNDHYLSIVEDDRYRQAELLLDRRVSTSVERLDAHLEHIRQHHDLTWEQLLTSHREIKQMLRQQNNQPSIWLYWEEVAHPRSLPLFDAGMAAIDQELIQLRDAISRFRTTTSRMETVDSAITTDSVRRVLDLAGQASIGEGELHAIGIRWQKRLRRAAVRQVAMRVVTSDTNNAESIVDQMELELLNSAPWAHMDRLLMAFELTHADIRGHLRDGLASLAVIETPLVPPLVRLPEPSIQL
jgi:hypothetical protein